MFAHLVQFIEKQAKIWSNQIFGDIQETVATAASKSKRHNTNKSVFRPKLNYVTNVATISGPASLNMNSDVKPP